MVSTCPLFSKLSTPSTNPLLTTLSSSITIGTSTTFMFQFFFSSLARSRYYLSSLHFYPVVSRKTKLHYSAGSLCFLLTITRSARPAEIRWFACIKKSQRMFYHILSDGFQFMHVLIALIIKLKFLAQFPVDHLVHPVVYFLKLYLC